ncbi:MAG: cytochrome C [Bacteroidetes bacterium]|jgi:hypothetical protein|nr:cytochrome C [Bacteroidota bacterium]MDP7195565.1 heme-binding domain-containing protein [SAR202 cluster bacterium]|tara:strand:- start:275 stop:727 length:453 start_codon:yes stop_codon:yes gene_type:complete
MKKAIYIFVALLIIIQSIPANLPEVSSKNPNDLIANNSDIPKDVKMILKNSCYDCHSNETHYPWYSYVVPVSFLVSRDIIAGREELNFSNWEDYKKTEKAEILDEISEYVSDGKMPMKIYTLIHRDAVLSDDEKEIIVVWAEEFAESLFE